MAFCSGGSPVLTESNGYPPQLILGLEIPPLMFSLLGERQYERVLSKPVNSFKDKENLSWLETLMVKYGSKTCM